MLYKIEGTVEHVKPFVVYLTCSQITFEIITPIYNIKSGAHITLFVYFMLKDNIPVLYGFRQNEEREIFINLIKLPGIGPGLAIRLLSGLSPADFLSAVEREDVAEIASIKGIGKKRAERIIFEIKGKFPLTEGEETGAYDIRRTLINSLLALGLSENDARRAVNAYFEKTKMGDINIEEALKSILKRMR